MPVTRKHACHIFMSHALIEPVQLEFNTPKTAKNWRFECYNIRQALQAGGDMRYDGLVIKVEGNKLTAEMKDG